MFLSNRGTGETGQSRENKQSNGTFQKSKNILVDMIYLSLYKRSSGIVTSKTYPGGGGSLMSFAPCAAEKLGALVSFQNWAAICIFEYKRLIFINDGI